MEAQNANELEGHCHQPEEWKIGFTRESGFVRMRSRYHQICNLVEIVAVAGEQFISAIPGWFQVIQWTPKNSNRL